MEHPLLPRIVSLLGSPDRGVVLQGCELLLSLQDPDLIGAVAEDTRIDSAGVIVPGARLCRTIQHRNWRPWITLRIIDAMVALRLHPPPTRLDLRYARLTESLSETLLSLRWLDSLVDLDLRGASLDDDGIAQLVDRMPSARLTTLRLQQNDLTAAGVRALWRLPGLRTLDLRFNAIGADGARALTEAPFAAGLQTLLLYIDDVGEDGAEVLAYSSLSPDLRCLWRARITQHPGA